MATTDRLELVASDGSKAVILRQGAQVLSWHPAASDRDALFLSPLADFAPGGAVRGGIPVVFPQFAERGPMAKHGFARNLLWEQVSLISGEGGAPTARFRLVESAETMTAWPHAFQVEVAVTIGGPTIIVAVEIINTGVAMFSCASALHTYFAVDDVTSTTVHGLEGRHYTDTAGQNQEVVQPDAPITFGTEIDRIYAGSSDTVTIDAGDRRYMVQCEGFQDTVVWNPGPARAATIGDLGADDWRRFVCVESGAIVNRITLRPNERWSGFQAVSVQSGAVA